MKKILSSILMSFPLAVAWASPQHIMDDTYFTKDTKYVEILEKGDAEAQYDFGKQLLDGDGLHFVGAGHFKAGVKMLEKAASKGYTPAMYELGMHYRHRESRKAIKWFTKAAEKGYASAQVELGDMYMYGTSKIFSFRAFKWYKKAAEQGSAEGQYGLGMCYGLGVGVWKNDKKSDEWNRKAAEQGHSGAQSLLGSRKELEDK